MGVVLVRGGGGGGGGGGGCLERGGGGHRGELVGGRCEVQAGGGGVCGLDLEEGEVLGAGARGGEAAGLLVGEDEVLEGEVGDVGLGLQEVGARDRVVGDSLVGVLGLAVLEVDVGDGEAARLRREADEEGADGLAAEAELGVVEGDVAVEPAVLEDGLCAVDDGDAELVGLEGAEPVEEGAKVGEGDDVLGADLLGGVGDDEGLEAAVLGGVDVGGGDLVEVGGDAVSYTHLTLPTIA